MDAAGQVRRKRHNRDLGDNGDNSDWQYQGVCVRAEGVEAAIRSCRRGKTCSRDGIVSETWQALIASDARWSAAIAWSFNRRLENMP